MNENLKIDIIYYETVSDFAFEFNLGGYCRSRVLTATADSPKELVTALAKAVSRSRIILITGLLTGQNGLTTLVGKAISRDNIPVDQQAYQIKSDEELTMLENGVPLVTSKGMFGGCIVESGPQSIILLSADPKVRTVIMEELVSQYITTIGQTNDVENNILEQPVHPASEKSEEKTTNTTISIPMFPTGDLSESLYMGKTMELPLTDKQEPETPMIFTDELPGDLPAEVPFITNQTLAGSKESTDAAAEDEPPVVTLPEENTLADLPVDEETPSFEAPVFPTITFEENKTSDIPDTPPTEPCETHEPDNEPTDIWSAEDISSEAFEEDTDEADNAVTAKKRSKGLAVAIWVLLIALVLVVIALAYLLWYIPGLNGYTPLEYLHELFGFSHVGGLL